MEHYQRLARALAPMFGLPVADRGETDTRVYSFGADDESIIEAKNAIRNELARLGWSVTTFGGKDDPAPDFKRNGYAARNLYIFNPGGGNGALTWDARYTWCWRASHEYGHAVTQAGVVALYGQTKRAGKLGAGMTLHDCEAAVYWEALAFGAQARFLHDVGLPQSADAIRAESGINMLDAVVRCLTGGFSDPAKAGIYATSECLSQSDALLLAVNILRAFDSGAIQLGAARA